MAKKHLGDGSPLRLHWRPGRDGRFSLEASLGVHFLTRSRVFDEQEQAWLDACRPRVGPP